VRQRGPARAHRRPEIALEGDRPVRLGELRGSARLRAADERDQPVEPAELRGSLLDRGVASARSAANSPDGLVVMRNE